MFGEKPFLLREQDRRQVKDLLVAESNFLLCLSRRRHQGERAEHRDCNIFPHPILP